jgi:hypothetical protein
LKALLECLQGVTIIFSLFDSNLQSQNKNHAEKVVDMALDMRDCVTFVKDPRPEFTEDQAAHVRIRWFKMSLIIQPTQDHRPVLKALLSS